MRNRAKCKLCSDILESFHQHDYVTCSCGEISIDGGQSYLRCAAKNWENFLRIDDDGKEIAIKLELSGKAPGDSSGSDGDHNSDTDQDKQEHKKPSKDELINMLEEMIKSIESLPPHAMTAPINHYDFSSLLILLLAFFKDDCNSVN